ncbi:hypothetical protein LOK49_LG10G02646 [Camellia lanceoleosa]|uniref:Uncharacterized protein n=1 Tax=Camellia lanceoleosa TaxID=1840588 RepID=A0ACC0GBU2_9ERIC|nr:hypothetical protein LOK49_LG10G02646 [Camellia lanceoleosa]
MEMKISSPINQYTVTRAGAAPNLMGSDNASEDSENEVAEEKGKLKHATVSPLLGETKDISSLKLPLSVCVYHVIDEVLPPKIPDAEVRSKLALTVINDCSIGEAELAQYFLAILNLSDEYKQWSKLSTAASEKLSDDKVETSVNSKLDKRQKQYATDHTQFQQHLFELMNQDHDECVKHFDKDQELEQLISGEICFKVYPFSSETNTSNTERKIMLSGSFNPLHEGHLKLLEVATRDESNNYQNKNQTTYFKMPCVIELYDAGVKFKAVNDDDDELNFSMFDIRFEHGHFKIPKFKVNDSTETFFQNIIAYEQHSSYDKPKYFTDYTYLMDQLINCKEDVTQLRCHEVLENWLGDDEVVALMFNNLGNGRIIEE